MRALIFSSLFLICISSLALPAAEAYDSTKVFNKIQNKLFSFENIFKSKNDVDMSESNLRLKMVTRIVAGIVLIVGILGTLTVQLRLISIGLGTVSEKPETLGGLIILMLLPESIVLLSFVISILLILI